MDSSIIKQQAVRFTRAQRNLLAVVALTAINLVLYVTGTDISFLYSAFFPQAVLIFVEAWFGSLWFGFAIAIATAAIYLACWALSRRWRWFILVALILFFLDTAFLAWILVPYILNTGDGFIWALIELGFAIWILISLISGTIAWAKLRRATPDEIKTIQQEITQEEEKKELNSALDAIAPDQDDDSPPAE
ncbi:MAG: hypothetical protein FWC96_09710 [Oscillospiraceae bacterium]|nr:hypothetical protein [Oscillospiraceae bacterium]